MIRQPLAPWWKRLIAILLDGVVLFFATFVIALIAAAIAGHNTNNTNNTNASGASVLGALFVVWIAASIPAAIYYAAMNGSRRGQTVGKMALGIAVRDARTGGPIGFWRALGRNLITVVFEALFSIPYILDSLAPLWDARRQAWHDKVAHSVVVDLKP
ncbi:MAG: RDD family protein [Acidimicrobiales bacterium]